MNIRRCLRVLTLLPVLCLAGMAVQAQTWPSKPIRLIVPFPPGGSADLAARAVAQSLAQDLGQTLIVDNRAGADGAIAAEAVTRSAPDGYTLFFATNTAMLAVPTLRKTPPYDPIADFTPISLVGRFGFFVFAHPSLPASSAQEMLAYVRAHPGQVNYGTGNASSILATAQLARQEKLDMLHVPYKGDAPLTTDLLAGRIHLAVATAGTALVHANEGKLRVLATLLPTRSALVPDVPTMPEAGIHGLNITPWAAMFGPAKLPRDITGRVASALQRVLASTELKAQLSRYAFEAQSAPPQELAAYLKDQYEVWSRTAQDVGLARE